MNNSMNNSLAPVVHKLDMSACSPDKVNTKYIRGLYDDYYILQYSNLGISFNDYKNTLYRSVVFSNPQKQVLSFTPMKSMQVSDFIENYPSITDNIYINEYIEGLMVQLFYDHRINKWIMGTKGGIGGNYCFGAEKKKDSMTFYDMLLDALHTNRNETLNKTSLLEFFPTKFSYTFIMQHPKNTIITPVDRPHLYIVSVYFINSEDNQVEYVSPLEYESWPAFKNIDGIIEFPKQYLYSDYKSVINDCEENKDIGHAGVIITNTITGRHCRIKTPVYELFKKTLNIDAETEYLYLCIRRINRVKEFLKYYPKYKRAFHKLNEQYDNMVKTVYQYYCDYYIYGLETRNGTVGSKYFTHIYKIHHNIYIPSFAVKNIGRVRICRKTVREYFDKMEPRELLYILSEDRRQ